MSGKDSSSDDDHLPSGGFMRCKNPAKMISGGWRMRSGKMVGHPFYAGFYDPNARDKDGRLPFVMIASPPTIGLPPCEGGLCASCCTRKGCRPWAGDPKMRYELTHCHHDGCGAILAVTKAHARQLAGLYIESVATHMAIHATHTGRGTHHNASARSSVRGFLYAIHHRSAAHDSKDGGDGGDAGGDGGVDVGGDVGGDVGDGGDVGGDVGGTSDSKGDSKGDADGDGTGDVDSPLSDGDGGIMLRCDAGSCLAYAGCSNDKECRKYGQHCVIHCHETSFG